MEQKNQNPLSSSYENGQMKTCRERRDYEKWTIPTHKTQNYSDFSSPKSKERKNFFNKYAKMTSSYWMSDKKK